MQALKAAGMTKVGERLKFEQDLLAMRDNNVAAPVHELPGSFIESAFPTKRDYEASLLLNPADRVFAENAARRRVNAGLAVDGVEKPSEAVHGLIHGAPPSSSSAPEADARSTFEFFLAARGAVDENAHAVAEVAGESGRT